VFIIAEISANHGQNFNRAVSLIKKAKESGADAVKFQTYTPDSMTVNSNNKYFRLKHSRWGEQNLYQLYSKAYIPWNWFKKLKQVSADAGIIFFSTAYDKSAVDFLEELEVPVHKIASFELIDLPLVEYVAKTKKPLIISTGMGSISEIREAVNTARNAGARHITLLKCVSSYPAKPEDMNLKTIPHMKKLFNCPVGLSDHTLGTEVSTAAVSLGAQVIEKHFTLSRNIKTLDSFFSIEPKELKELVEKVRIVKKALGKIHYGLTKEEKKDKSFRRRRSLFIVKDMKKGEVLNEENVKSIRSSYGLPSKYLYTVLGKNVERCIKKGTPLKSNFIA